MKVIFETAGSPFYLAHGGARTQILSTVHALRDLGVDVEFARWWDSEQTGDILHVFSVPTRTYLSFAQKKGLKVVNTTLLTGACNRPNWRLSVQGKLISTMLAAPNIPPLGMIRSQFRWDSYAKCDRNVVGLKAEADVLTHAYNVDPEQIRIIPLGLAEPFLKAGMGPRNHNHLITTGTITERKGSLELARLAKDTGVPICFVGKPYDAKERYWKQFRDLIDDQLVKYVSHTDSVEEMIQLLQTSRGFVLNSDRENWCLSAHEAAACGLPLLLPEQRWSRERFGDSAFYLKKGDMNQNRAALKSFHEVAPTLPSPGIKHHSWSEVAAMLLKIYEEIIPSR